MSLPATSQEPGDEPAPRDRSRSGLTAAAAVVVVLVVALAWAVLWWRLAPTARTTVSDGAIYLNGHDELNIAQDGWFALLAAISGGVLAVVLPVLVRGRPIVAFVAGVLASAAAGLIALGVGGWLGPDGLKAQYESGVKAPITPIQVHAPVALMLLIAPMFFALVRFVAELLTAALGGRAGDPVSPVAPTGPWAGGDPSAAQGVHVEQGQRGDHRDDGHLALQDGVDRP